MPCSWSFDVTVSTHDLLKDGIVERRLPGAPAPHHRCVVAADTETEAALLAAQMAWCTAGYVTGVYLRI